MNRIVEIEIAGKKYPLSFSLGAAKKIANKYGSLEKAFNKMTTAKETTSEMLESLVFILSVLIKQGCDYMRIFEGAEIKPISEEEIENVISISDIERIANAVIAAMNSSQKKEIETKVNPKNAKAPKAI